MGLWLFLHAGHLAHSARRFYTHSCDHSFSICLPETDHHRKQQQDFHSKKLLSNLTLDTTVRLHVRPTVAVAPTVQCKSPPNLFCFNWMAGLLHSPALWHNSSQNALTCKWVASAAVARWRCNSWYAHDLWHGGPARTRPEAPHVTPRWATDVILLTSNDGSVPVPSGGQWWEGGEAEGGTLKFLHGMGKWLIGWLP